MNDYVLGRVLSSCGRWVQFESFSTPEQRTVYTWGYIVSLTGNLRTRVFLKIEVRINRLYNEKKKKSSENFLFVFLPVIPRLPLLLPHPILPNLCIQVLQYNSHYILTELNTPAKLLQSLLLMMQTLFLA